MGHLIEFDEKKISEINTDFSIFVPTLRQYELIETLSKNLASRLHIDHMTVLNIYIRALIRYQEYHQQFHYVNEKNLPQFKIARSQKINEFIVELIWDLQKNNDKKEETKKIINKAVFNVFEQYTKEFASRSID